MNTEIFASLIQHVHELFVLEVAYYTICFKKSTLDKLQTEKLVLKDHCFSLQNKKKW